MENGHTEQSGSGLVPKRPVAENVKIGPYTPQIEDRAQRCRRQKHGSASTCTMNCKHSENDLL